VHTGRGRVQGAHMREGCRMHTGGRGERCKQERAVGGCTQVGWLQGAYREGTSAGCTHEGGVRDAHMREGCRVHT
jgi:hypothetical protein